MCKTTQVWPATRIEYDAAAQHGGRAVRIVVNSCLRDGYHWQDWYIYESAQMYFKCFDPERELDPNAPPEV